MTAPEPIRRARPAADPGRGWCLLAGFALLLALGCAAGEAEPDAGATSGGVGGITTSLADRYRIEVRPADPSVALGTLHDWIVRIERLDGAPARPTHLVFDGGMPAHGHGFVTAPRVTRALGDGRFLVEGVKFHMAGDWELRVAVADAEGGDTASLQIAVAP